MIETLSDFADKNGLKFRYHFDRSYDMWSFEFILSEPYSVYVEHVPMIDVAQGEFGLNMFVKNLINNVKKELLKTEKE